MRTTLSIHDALLRKAKEAAVARDVSLSVVVEEALRVTLGAKEKGGRKRPRSLKTFRGDGVQPGVDLTSGASLLEAMESR
jgi:hypothetical protein